MRKARNTFAIAFTAAASIVHLFAQTGRIAAPIDGRKTVTLTNQTPRHARTEVDQGPVAATFPLTDLTISFKPSASQQAVLDRLLAAQQNPASGEYHKWLTPEQYAERFGLRQDDVNRVSAWLASQGFKVNRVARSRTWIQFSGPAQAVERAFSTSVHQYLRDGKLHYANTSDPSIPASLSGIALSIRGLNNYRLAPQSRLMRGGPLDRTPAGATPADTTGQGQHQMAPDDFAIIYDVAPLYSAGIDGTGQKLVIVGQTDINLSDLNAFTTQFNLPAMKLQQILVPGQADPGISAVDLPEADLDLEWAGAVARGANILYVYANDVNTALQEAVDQAYAPVISMSYSVCEQANLVDLPTLRQLAQQANAGGMTWLAATGDSGAGACEDLDATIAQDGLAVAAPASIPEVTAMGGTEFNEGSGSYWNTSNTANAASALSYIPEMVWNDSSAGGSLAAGGGGVSIFFSRPIWQTGPSVPSDGFRHVPDLSIASSADHDGYFVHSNGQFQIFGGTSIAAPTMAGIVALLNQYLATSGAQQPGVGNINPALYRMAQSAAGLSAAKQPFHDVTMGNNKVPCVIGSPNCTTGELGYSAGAGYDQASGLGSPDAYNLVHQWSSSAPTASAVVPSIDQNPVFETANGWKYTITLTEEAGAATTVTAFAINGQNQDVKAVFGSNVLPPGGFLTSNGLAFNNLTVPTNVVFSFSGTDASGTQWSQQLSVPFQGPQPQLSVGGVSNAASGQQSFAPGMLISLYGTALGDFAQVAGTVPLPQYLSGFEAWVNGVPAPLYYVSPNQVNVQIPYGTPLGSAALVAGNPYANSNNYNLNIVAAAPGIFMTNGFTAAPFSSAAAGAIATLYITGSGILSPALATGSAPLPGTPVPQLPKPSLPVAVTVAGQPAAIDFIGNPVGLVGVTQINYQVPASAPSGVQQVVVTVGEASSQPANLTVTH